MLIDEIEELKPIVAHADGEAFILWLIASPLTAGERVQLKKDFEFVTGKTFPRSDFNRIRGANPV